MCFFFDRWGTNPIATDTDTEHSLHVGPISTDSESCYLLQELLRNTVHRLR